MSEAPRHQFGDFYRKTVAPLRRYLANMLGNHTEAQDLAHDAYLRVFEAMDQREVAKPRPFLFTTARRLALNYLQRRRSRWVQGEEGDNVIAMTPTSGPSVERTVMARQEWAAVELAIEGLPFGCRTVLRLSKIEHLSHQEISERLGIAVSTVEKQHARALRLIQVALDELMPERKEDQERNRAQGR